MRIWKEELPSPIVYMYIKNPILRSQASHQYSVFIGDDKTLHNWARKFLKWLKKLEKSKNSLIGLGTYYYIFIAARSHRLPLNRWQWGSPYNSCHSSTLARWKEGFHGRNSWVPSKYSSHDTISVEKDCRRYSIDYHDYYIAQGSS